MNGPLHPEELAAARRRGSSSRKRTIRNRVVAAALVLFGATGAGFAYGDAAAGPTTASASPLAPGDAEGSEGEGGLQAPIVSTAPSVQEAPTVASPSPVVTGQS
jgi:phage tail sheath protein FI